MIGFKDRLEEAEEQPRSVLRNEDDSKDLKNEIKRLRNIIDSQKEDSPRQTMRWS